MGYLDSLWRNSGGYLRKVEQKGIHKTLRFLTVDEQLNSKVRLFVKELTMALKGIDMLHPSLRPPECVQGMTTLEKDKFNKTIKVPGIKLPKKEIRSTQKSWKPLLLKLKGLKPIAELDGKDPLKDSHSLILFDPGKLIGSSDDKQHLDEIQRLGFSHESLEKFELEIGYDNWSVADVMRAVLPEDADNVSSFTQIGHIAHLNLREENLPFKHLIGQVILDKVSSVTTVVNKLNTIDNTYRNFEMELLAGENNFVTQTKEHNCVFEMDFSKVYWNSRLSTEHQRIVDSIPKSSIVYDVFAGIGPFTVPLAKKRGCTILANDLNPYSFESLVKNIELNKLKKSGFVQAYNMDGRDFIRNVVKRDLSKRIEATYSKRSKLAATEQSDIREHCEEPVQSGGSTGEVCPSTFAVMNLPALAVDFLDAFVSLLSDLPTELRDTELIDAVLPTIFCYAFCGKKGDFEAELKQRAESILSRSLPSDAVVRVVRNVSPNKEMVCLTFKLWSGLVLAPVEQLSKKEQDDEEPDSKRLKCS